MSSSKRDTGTPNSRASPSVSFCLPELPLTPSSLLVTPYGDGIHQSGSSRTGGTVKNNRHRTSRSTILKNSNPTNNTTANTPGNEDSMILLPPSQTISESLSALAISTAAQLEEVWDELGFSPEERADQLTDLLAGFRKLCQDKIESELLVATNYRQAIADYKKEIRQTSLALKIEVDEVLLREETGQSLQDEVMTLEMKLEDLRAVADVAKGELLKYKQQLVEGHEALGLSLEESWLDDTSDLTESRIEQFRGKVKDMEESILHRTSAIVQLIKDCQDLISILKCDEQENELDYKIMNSLEKNEDNKTATIVSIFASDSCTGISSKTLNDLTRRMSELHCEKRLRREKLTEMGAVIAELWEKLHVPKVERKNFSDSIDGLGLDTLVKGEKELARLYELKSQMMGKLTLEAREKIKSLWDETNATEAQRDSFKSMLVTDEVDFNDELLEKHELCILKLEKRLEEMRPILDIIVKRESILSERMQYEEFLKDPDRLKQRGAALTKQLMKEEKMSRRIKKDLPKYSNHLEKKLKEWAEKNEEEAFLYKGEVYLDVMKRQEEEWMEYKDEQMKLKLQKKQQSSRSISTDKTTSSYSSTSGFYHHAKKNTTSATNSSEPFADKSNKTSRPVSRHRATNSSAPLADRTNNSRPGSRLRGTNSSESLAEKAIKTRPLSRFRAISRGRKRDEKSKIDAEPKKNTSRGRNPSRARGNISRGRAFGMSSRGRA